MERHWNRRPPRRTLVLVLCLVVAHLPGLIGSQFVTPQSLAWYRSLAQPWFSPPRWVFGPVWGGLYTLTGIAFYLALTSQSKSGSRPRLLFVFSLQLVLNATYTPVFFGLRSLQGGLTICAVLLPVIVWTMREFQHYSYVAAGLLAPYALWVLFATVLSGALIRLN